MSGLDAGTTSVAELEQLRAVMRKYSQNVTRFLTTFLSPYRERWQLDYTSFRPQEEQGRDLPLRRRNDLLHTDAFPTRPTRGARILRFFNNIHPSRTRDWVVSDPFALLAPRYAPQQIPLPAPGNSASRTLRSVANAAGLGSAIPSLKRCLLYTSCHAGKGVGVRILAQKEDAHTSLAWASSPRHHRSDTAN